MRMKTVRNTAKSLCAAVFAAAALLCLKPAVSFAAYSYPNPGKYTAGDAKISKTVKNLDVDWVNGKVTIAYHRDNTVELSEKSSKTISGDMRMRWWVDGDTLRVRFAKPGFRQLKAQEKELTITLPEEIRLNDVSIHATSGSLFIPALQSDSLKLNVTSGNITATVESRSVSTEATSGDLDLRILGKAKNIEASSTSGTVEIEAESVDKLSTSSSSGTVRMTAKKVGEFLASSTAGDIDAEIDKVRKAAVSSNSGRISVEFGKFDSLSISATSGDVCASLPDKPGFTAQLKVTSGDIEYDLPLRMQGKTYICGDGSGEVSIETTSGDITLK